MIENICIVYPGDISTPKGGENRVIAFAKKLRDSGFNVHLVIPRPKRQIPEDLYDISIHTVPISTKDSDLRNQLFRVISLISKAKEIAKKYNAILQFEHSHFAGFATLVDKFNHYIVDMHDLAFAGPVYSKYPLLRKSINWIEKRGVKYALKTIVVSEPMKKFIIKEWNVAEDKIYVIPHGYFESKFEKLNLKLNNTEDVDGLIAFLGTLHLKIDLDKIIYLAKSLKNNSKIYIIGDGPARIYLERKIIQHNLKNVIVTGWLPDEEAYKLLAESQVVIYPIKKSLDLHTRILTSVKIFDYSALGKAMVLDDVSESEVWKELKEKKAAMFSDPNDPSEFVNCVQKLLENEKLRKKMGAKAKEIVKKYTWEKMGDRLVKMYMEMI